MIKSESPFTLSIGQLTIEFLIDERRSLELSTGFSHHGPDYLFAVAEVWIVHGGSRFQLENADRPENLFAFLYELARWAAKPPAPLGLKDAIPCCGWARWMAGYWDRVRHELETDEDEKLYAILSSLSFASTHAGAVALYSYGAKHILEVFSRDGSSSNVCVEFSAQDLSRQVSLLAEAVRERLAALR
ncbi:hypothetical protein [Caenimonas koreensis]|uniref:hypothetical protein n=1 Tax=Caenimonas koreensis TaxID=367474 RepID=UPI003784227A